MVEYLSWKPSLVTKARLFEGNNGDLIIPVLCVTIFFRPLRLTNFGHQHKSQKRQRATFGTLFRICEKVVSLKFRKVELDRDLL